MDFCDSIRNATALCLGVGLFLLNLAPALAYENFDYPSPILKCQTTCHKPENVLQIKQDKTQKQECKDCHMGVDVAKVKSPFRPLQKFKRIKGENTGSLQRSLIPPVVQMAAKAKKDAEGKSSPQSPPPATPSENSGMVLIPAGEFIMGSNERWDDEAPEHIASTEAFYIDLYEVTNEDYKAFTDATQHETPYHWPEGVISKGKEKHPVVYVSWFDARGYCAWKGKRLPTEQEWEKASRGEDGLIYPWGYEWTLDKSNNPYKYSTGTEPVGSYPEGRSPYGLYDMSGNVWEWVDSYYLPHPGNPVVRGEYGEDKRVLKGGSWFDCLSYGCGLSAPTFNRSFFTPEVRNNSFGFRCAKSP